MMRLSVLLVPLFTYPSWTHGWIANNHFVMFPNKPNKVASAAITGTLLASNGRDDIPLTTEVDTNDPCWGNMLDDDCSMGTIYAANFVASKWIKSMPCGEGIEDCDMPAALTTPETRPESNIENVDVMGFLGLKRVQSLNKRKEDDNNDLSP